MRRPPSQEKAVGVVWLLSSDADNKQAIVAADGFAALVGLLHHGSPLAQERSAGALGYLARNAESAIAIAAAGAWGPLMELIRRGRSRGAREKAAKALSLLEKLSKGDSKNEETKMMTFAQLIGVAQMGSAEQQQKAASFLRDLAFSPGHATAAIAAAGGVAPLVELVCRVLGLGSDERERATFGLVLLASGNWEDTKYALEVGLTPLLEIAVSGSAEGRENAATALAGIATGAAEESKGAVGAALVAEDGIAPLVELLRSGSEVAQEKAVQVLSTLAEHGASNSTPAYDLKAELEKADGLSALIELASSGSEEVRQAASAALTSLRVDATLYAPSLRLPGAVIQKV